MEENNKDLKRPFSEMKKDFTNNLDKIIVSRLKTPTKLHDLSGNKKKIKINNNVESDKNIATINMNSFYKENLEELNNLVVEYEQIKKHHDVVEAECQELQKQLDFDIVPKIEMHQNVLLEAKKYSQELDQLYNSIIDLYDKDINKMTKEEVKNEEEILKKNDDIYNDKKKSLESEQENLKDKYNADLNTLKDEISALQKENKLKRASLESKEDFLKQQKELDEEMTTLKNDTIKNLQSESERLKLANGELSKEVDNLKSNIQNNLIRQTNELEKDIEKQQKHLDNVVEKRIQKIEESAVVARQYEQMQSKYNQLQSQLQICDNQIKLLSGSIQYHKDQLQEKEMSRRTLHNKLQDLRGNIRVFCRIKPESNPQFMMQHINKVDPDESITEHNINNFDRAELEVEMPASLRNSNLSSPSKRDTDNSNENKSVFTFDKIFDQKASNETIFEEVSQLVQSSLDGYKVCIFAYGQTGSGKTYTMLHPGDGIIPSTLKHIYTWIESLKSLGWQYKVKMQFVEIYNENIIDLFSNNDQAKPGNFATRNIKNKKIDIRHHPDGKTTLTNVHEIDITDGQCNAEEILRGALKNRATAATKENDHSSRSHSVFTLRLLGENSITSKTCEGVLNLIDLAGSERLNKSQATGDRLRETQAINKSLSCLGDVIHSLSSAKNIKTAHIPFRNSKLTYMLQNYLTGDGKALMFVNVSSRSYSETMNSLRFSSKVNNTKMR